jgi:hypothetical protein
MDSFAHLSYSVKVYAYWPSVAGLQQMVWQLQHPVADYKQELLQGSRCWLRVWPWSLSWQSGPIWWNRFKTHPNVMIFSSTCSPVSYHIRRTSDSCYSFFLRIWRLFHFSWFIILWCLFVLLYFSCCLPQVSFFLVFFVHLPSVFTSSVSLFIFTSFHHFALSNTSSFLHTSFISCFLFVLFIYLFYFFVF